MLRVTLKGLWAHKRRLLGTFAAVALGVAFLSGTLVLGDTLKANFDDLFTEANAGIDTVVRGDAIVDSDFATDRPLVDASLARTIIELDVVAAAVPQIEGYGALVGEDGKTVGGGGPPTLAGNWIADDALNPFDLAEGREPRADDEVVVNRAALDDAGLELGSTAVVQTPDPIEVTVVGISTFGDEDGLAGTTYVAFTTGGAQRYLLGEAGAGKATAVLVRAADGVTEEELADRVREVTPEGTEVLTGTELTTTDLESLDEDFLTFFRGLMSAFAAIALLVACFSIYNTFSILVAQRTRESALLRALGASRRQVLTSVVGEAAAIGLVASGAGLGGGLLVAGMLKALFDAVGFSLPAGGLVVKPAVVISALLVGSLVTLVASIGPSLRASRVKPIAALREVATEDIGASRRRAILGLVVTGAGVALVMGAVAGAGENMLATAGFGAMLCIVGFVILGPVVARPAVGAIGAPLPRLRGIVGALARQGAMRNPRRTAGSAAALMVGVSVVTLFTVVAASIKVSIDRSVDRSFGGDLVVAPAGFGPFGGFSPKMADEIAGLDEVETAAGLGFGVALIDGDETYATVAEPATLGKILDVAVTEGALEDLGDDGMAVSASRAEDRDWAIGTKVPVTFVDGDRGNLTVGAIYEESDVVGAILLSRAAYAPHAAQSLDSTVLVDLADGVSIAEGRRAVESVSVSYGDPDVNDREEYADQVAGAVNQMLGLIYVMLALAIIIALMGIANTISLSVHERTRELGLLRAVGQTRGQMRSMVRWESVVIATFGTVGGMGIGVFLGWALVLAASGEGISTFAAPPGQLLTVLLVGAFAGVAAGFRPARRAAKLNILEAIATH